jgi:hypothetical protein
MGGSASGKVAALASARFLYLLDLTLREEPMKTNWEHQKKAITTDQKFRAEDEHIHERDKQRVKESEEPDPELIPKPAEKAADREE